MKKSAIFVILFLLSFFIFSEEKSVITIKQAQKTEYKKDKINGGEAIILTGGVVISIDNGKDSNTISADKVSYNRTTDMIYAEGNVSLKHTGGSDGGEDMTASSLIFNTMTMEGVFDDGRIVQSQSSAMNLPSGSKLVVASDLFGRDNSGTITFKRGELTFCDDENPHWKIKASRIWLLPGGEFAFLNALIFVGHIPVMYLPAFYYPKDELIINPAFGYDNRRGYFLNTTAYIIGRKPLDAKTPSNMRGTTNNDSDVDLYSFMKPNKLKKQVREGLVLHNTDEDFTGDTSNYLKIMGDYYTKLGGMVGVDSVFNNTKIFQNFEGSLRLGFSNTLFRLNNYADGYTAISQNGKSFYNKSEFLSMKLPFRYAAKLKFSINHPFNLNFSMPIYSDPYFEDDFGVRAESMDWISYLMNGGKDTIRNYSVTETSSFSWELSSSYTPNLPQIVKPWLSTLSLSKISSSIIFSSIDRSSGTDGGWSDEEIREGVSIHQSNGTGSPMTKFYYPSQITPVKLSTRIAGTIFQWPLPEKTKTKPAPNVQLNETAYIGEFEQHKKTETENSGTAENNPSNPDDEIPVENLLLSESSLPSIVTPSFSASQLSDIKYNLTYAINPEYVNQLSYASEGLKKPSDFSWSDLQSVYQYFTAPTTVSSSFNYRDNFVTLSDTFIFNPVYQDHPYINDSKYTESSKNSVLNSDYSARKLDLTNSNTLSFRPFAYTEHFAGTGISYNTTFKMIRTKYISSDPNEPEWEYLTCDVTDDESFTLHNLTFTLAAKEGDYSQNLSLVTTLPPQVDNYHGTFTNNTKYTTFSLGTGFKRKSKTDDSWMKENLSQSFSVRLFNSKLTLSESYIRNLEENYDDSLRLSLSGYGVQFAFTSSYVNGYTFERRNGSKIKKYYQDSEKRFQPYNMSLAYTSPSKTFKYLNDKLSIAPSLSTSIVYDFLRPTNSYFIFKPSLTLKIANALDLTFSMESRNNVIYRYIKNISSTQIDVGGEDNLWVDLWNSFRFDDESKRRSSGFKLKSLNIKISHDLHDWNFNAEFSIKPRLLTENGKSYYDFTPYMSFSIVWKPLEGIKTSIVDDYGEWKLNPSSSSSD